MPMFSVDFALAGNISVDCEDEQDAKEFVETVGAEQILLWLIQRNNISMDRYAQVVRVVPEASVSGSRKL